MPAWPISLATCPGPPSRQPLTEASFLGPLGIGIQGTSPYPARPFDHAKGTTFKGADVGPVRNLELTYWTELFNCINFRMLKQFTTVCHTRQSNQGRVAPYSIAIRRTWPAKPLSRYLRAAEPSSSGTTHQMSAHTTSQPLPATARYMYSLPPEAVKRLEALVFRNVLGLSVRNPSIDMSISLLLAQKMAQLSA